MTTQGTPAALSETLLAAQERLLALRRALFVVGDSSPPAERPLRIRNPQRSVEALVAALPDHLGWGSAPLTAHLRAAARRTGPDRPQRFQKPLRSHKRSAGEPAPTATVKVYPDLALAMLRSEQAAAGRVWLLLRALDETGAGRVDVAPARARLTGDGEPLRVCGARQWRNLLARGEGLFWTQSDGRLWLRSTARVAAALGARRLGGSPVAVPLAALTGTIGRVRAHLYAAFHSSRTRPDLLGREPTSRGPVSRAALRRLSRACPNSQRNYERLAGVRARRNYAVGPAVDPTQTQEQGWRRGRALFRLTDRAGRHGRPGATYLAWQLPNTYLGPHARLPRGRQKRINRALADLFDNGMTGNVERPEKRFYGQGAAAAAERRRAGGHEVYWQGAGGYWYCWSPDPPPDLRGLAGL